MAELIRINNELTRLSKSLALAVGQFEVAIKEAAEKRTDRDVRWAQELLKADGKTVAERESEVMIICQSFVRECRIAEAMRDGLKERIRAIESVISVQQSQLRHFEESERVNL